MYHITLCRSKKIIYPEGGFIAMNPEAASHTLHRLLKMEQLKSCLIPILWVSQIYHFMDVPDLFPG